MFKVPYLFSVNTVKQYFEIPKKEREFYGLYRLPHSLPCERFSCIELGWETFYKEIKKAYPIQYFFREWLFGLNNPIIFYLYKFILWPVRDFKWKFKLFIKPLYPRWRASLKRWEYMDISCLVLKSNFALILDFYYNEVLDGFVDWQSDESHKNFYEKLVEYVKWIEMDSKVLDLKLDNLLTEATEVSRTSKGSLTYDEIYGEHNNLENEIFNKETEILKWFIDNRKFFWT